MFKITPPKDNAVSTTYQFLKSIGAKVTEETVEETLKNHPDYPSLLAISDALNEWHIENVAAQVNPEQLVELPTPFLTHLRVDGGMFALVKSVNADAVEWVHTTEGFKREKTDDFLKKWNGVVLMAETNTDSGEKNFIENRKIEILYTLRIPLLLIGASLLTISLFYHNFTTDWHYNALLLTKFVGIVVSGLLLWQSIDKNNPFIKNLCQAVGEANCNAILSSNAAQVTSWLSWSEVGFFYFAGGFIALLINPNSMFLFWVLGATALFYTCWSIYYQAFVVKQWCILCMTVQLLFVVEFLTSPPTLILLERGALLTISDFVTPLLGTGGAVLVWVFLKPILQKSQQVEPLKNDLRRFKNNPNLFLSLLQKQEEMPFVAEYMQPIIIGKADAEHTLTMVTNPFCQPCAKTHETIERLLEATENLKVQVIFLANNKDDDKRGIVARSILSLPKNQQANALSEWYLNEERSIEKWQKALEIIEDKKASNIIDYHTTWCEMAKIVGTPTLYLDGFKMPELYRLEDLKGVLKYLSQRIFENHK